MENTKSVTRPKSGEAPIFSSMKLSLSRKYRPQSISELVLPAQHSLKPVLAFMNNPYPSEWLFTGKSGLGKSSAAEIIAASCSDPSHVRHLVGSDLDALRVKDLEQTVRHRPLFGGFHAFVVNEADEITSGGQVRLLNLLESSAQSVWIFTSNLKTSSFDARFLSRVRHISFSAHGILVPASHWLADIAFKEGLPLTVDEAAKIIRGVQNNLRNALQELELRLLTVEPLDVAKWSENHSKTALNFPSGAESMAL